MCDDEPLHMLIKWERKHDTYTQERIKHMRTMQNHLRNDA